MQIFGNCVNFIRHDFSNLYNKAHFYLFLEMFLPNQDIYIYIYIKKLSQQLLQITMLTITIYYIKVSVT